MNRLLEKHERRRPSHCWQGRFKRGSITPFRGTPSKTPESTTPTHFHAREETEAQKLLTDAGGTCARCSHLTFQPKLPQQRQKQA